MPDVAGGMSPASLHSQMRQSRTRQFSGGIGFRCRLLRRMSRVGTKSGRGAGSCATTRRSCGWVLIIAMAPRPRLGADRRACSVSCGTECATDPGCRETKTPGHLLNGRDRAGLSPYNYPRLKNKSPGCRNGPTPLAKERVSLLGWHEELSLSLRGIVSLAFPSSIRHAARGDGLDR